MELWRELLVIGLQSGSCFGGSINDDTLIKIIKDTNYKVLLEIKNIIYNEKLSDKDCFMKIERLLYALEKNNIFCDRHDFG